VGTRGRGKEESEGLRLDEREWALEFLLYIYMLYKQLSGLVWAGP
jgi:hypothetical protein